MPPEFFLREKRDDFQVKQTEYVRELIGECSRKRETKETKILQGLLALKEHAGQNITCGIQGDRIFGHFNNGSVLIGSYYGYLPEYEEEAKVRREKLKTQRMVVGIQNIEGFRRLKAITQQTGVELVSLLDLALNSKGFSGTDCIILPESVDDVDILKALQEIGFAVISVRQSLNLENKSVDCISILVRPGAIGLNFKMSVIPDNGWYNRSAWTGRNMDNKNFVGLHSSVCLANSCEIAGKNENYVIVGRYQKPPSTVRERLDTFRHLVNKLRSSEFDKIIIGGDMNFYGVDTLPSPNQGIFWIPPMLWDKIPLGFLGMTFMSLLSKMSSLQLAHSNNDEIQRLEISLPNRVSVYYPKDEHGERIPTLYVPDGLKNIFTELNRLTLDVFISDVSLKTEIVPNLILVNGKSYAFSDHRGVVAKG